MKTTICLTLATFAMVATAAPLTAADSVNWITRCKRELGRTNEPETGVYYFSTPGMVEGAKGRARMDYKATGTRTSIIYPTAEKDFLSQWNGATVNVGYFADFAKKPPHDATLKIGQINMIVSGRDGKLPPGKVKVKLVADGKSFGPYEPDPTSLSSGMYSVWFDTAETDGDSKPPLLKPTEFAKLAKAVGVMKSAEMVLVRDGVDIARMPVPLAKRDAWRDGFAPWASSARGYVKSTWSCPNPMETQN